MILLLFRRVFSNHLKSIYVSINSILQLIPFCSDSGVFSYFTMFFHFRDFALFRALFNVLLNQRINSLLFKRFDCGLQGLDKLFQKICEIKILFIFVVLFAVNL